MNSIMKTFFTVILLLLFQQIANAQQINIWKDGQLTFITKYKVDSKGAEDETNYDASNDDVGINMEIIKYEDLNDAYKDIKYSSNEGCLDMEIEFKRDGGAFLNTYKSYYTVCYDKVYDEIVINAVIHRDDVEKAYDIALYCYNISVEEGLVILKSFTFLDD